jgi:hypothetical protein
MHACNLLGHVCMYSVKFYESKLTLFFRVLLVLASVLRYQIYIMVVFLSCKLGYN